MRLSGEQLPAALARRLESTYLVSGDEPLLADEAADAIRAAARAAGHADRTVFFVERGFAWDDLLLATQSMSLFAERRTIELRMPSGKPDKGADLLLKLAESPPPDIVMLIVTGKLDKKAGEAPWVRAVEKRGAWIPVWPVAAPALHGWLRARAAALGVRIEPDAAQLIVDRVEGNLLAAKQELDKLALLAGGRPIEAGLVLRSVGDSARYDVFQLAAAAAAGDARRAMRVLLGLKSEGVEPTLVLWALIRELRGLFQARERERLRSSTRASGWNLAATPSPRALARMKSLPLARLMREAALADRIVKGMAPGDAWSALTGLAGRLAGALQALPESGRVAP
ncbi:MAG TPA: DNA polymerase III subunit delta [Steroidobacteraceae bacterium]|jgi:DNA polymerase-3 subunit delta|nr:DNA polymerase III subunit delta [Steroidobacteraceae bacterium]